MLQVQLRALVGNVLLVGIILLAAGLDAWWWV